MTCQHSICRKSVVKVPIICIGSKSSSEGVHITFPILMGCEQHVNAITIEDILDAGGWSWIQKEFKRQGKFPDFKTLSFHLAAIEKVIDEIQKSDVKLIKT